MANEPETSSMVSRRTFLGGAVAGVAGSTLSGVTAAAQSSTTQEMRTDVVVCGSGMGLGAAMVALKAGLRVIVLEKAYEPGGTTAHSEGGVGTRVYENLRATTPDGDPVVQRMVADNIPKWHAFMDSIGAPLGGKPGGSRSIAPVMWVNWMVRTIESGGGRVLLETPMIKLLQNRLGEVIGVVADSPKGLIRILAKSVVLATGGWMGNAQMIQHHITRHFGGLQQRNAGYYDRKPPFLGDGLNAVLAVGGQPSTGGFDSFYGHLLPARPGKITNPMANWSLYHSPWCVAVNRWGRRFTDEASGKLSGRTPISQGEQNCVQEVSRQPDAMAAYIWDEPVNVARACEACALGGIDKYPAYGMAGSPTAKADTLADLAKQMEAWKIGVSAETVLREVTEYNMAASNGKAWALPIPKFNTEVALPLQTPPFYAVLGQAGITSTHGGIRVNENSQVLHRSGKPIPGLFAAGVDVGNYSNCTYNGNLPLGAGSSFAAGTAAAKQPAPRGGWEASATVAG